MGVQITLCGLKLHTHTHPFNCCLSRTTWVSQYQKGKTNLDFTEARDSEWQWHQLGHMQVCTSLQADNHASTPPLSFLQARCPSCQSTNSVRALKANGLILLKKFYDAVVVAVAIAIIFFKTNHQELWLDFCWLQTVVIILEKHRCTDLLGISWVANLKTPNSGCR